MARTSAATGTPRATPACGPVLQRSVLTPDFASDKTAYTLTLPQGVTGIRMTATASNKNNQVYLSADGTDYRRVETVPRP